MNQEKNIGEPRRALDPRKVEAQARAAVAALATLLYEALVVRRPADRATSAYMRRHRELGGRDRRFITESFYAVLRWWGWLRVLAPAAFLEMTKSPVARFGEKSHEDSDAPDAALAVPSGLLSLPWDRLLLGGLLLENSEEEEIVDLLAVRCGLDAQTRRAMAAERSREDRAFQVLRRLGGDAIESRPSPADLIPDWSTGEMDCPRPLTELLDWLQRRPPLWLRIQGQDPDAVAAELAAMGLSFEKHPVLPRALRVDKTRVNLYGAPVHREGRIEVQDLASQAVGAVCAPEPGQRWWDACAGGGGKSLLLAQLMNGKGTVVASDLRARKLTELRRRARRGGFSNIAAREWDGKRLRPRQATFDGALVDAPCSGSGTWRRNPAARWTIDLDGVRELSRLQLNIVENAASGVKPGGMLVYATCSLFRMENAGVVKDFLQKHPEFAVEPFAHPFSGNRTDGTLQIWPWDGDCDAMFVARFRRLPAISPP